MGQFIATDAKMTSILVVNPNSSASVTESMKKLLAPLSQDSTATSNVHVDYFTGPKEAPPEITNDATSQQSLEACLPHLRPLVPKYDGILVCCYSKHPLIAALNQEAKQSKQSGGKFITGIFESSIVYAVSKFPRQFFILTSNESWEPILNRSVKQYFGDVDIPFFNGTYSSKVNVLGLQKPENFEKIVKRVNDLLEKHPETEVILLGCAGFSGLEGKFKQHFPDIDFVDSVKIGYKLTNAFI